MRLPEPLRYNPFRFRRRRSLHSTLYGESRSGPIRHVDNVPSYRGTPSQTGAVSPKGYMSDFTEQYMPHPGFVETRDSIYQPYDGVQDTPVSSVHRINDEFLSAAMELAGIKSFQTEVKYEDSLMTEELFHQILEPLRLDVGDPLQPLFVNVDEIKQQLLACGFGHMLDGGQALQGPEKQFGELQLAELDAVAQIEDSLSVPDAIFDALQTETSPLVQEIVEEPMEGINTFEGPGPASLEQIVEAHDLQAEHAMPYDMTEGPGYDDCLMNHELFEQQMNEAAEQIEPVEQDPGVLQYDNGMMPQEMYDEQMQDPMDPFMRPDMMDPYMMPGPWGPMPGPGPGGP